MQRKRKNRTSKVYNSLLGEYEKKKVLESDKRGQRESV